MNKAVRSDKDDAEEAINDVPSVTNHRGVMKAKERVLEYSSMLSLSSSRRLNSVLEKMFCSTKMRVDAMDAANPIVSNLISDRQASITPSVKGMRET